MFNEPVSIGNAQHIGRMTKGGKRNGKQEPTGKSSSFQSASAKKSIVKANEDVTKLGFGGRRAALGNGKNTNTGGMTGTSSSNDSILLQMDKTKKKMNIIIIVNVVVAVVYIQLQIKF